MSKLLITASTGNIGSQMTKILKEKKVSFIAGVTANDKSTDGISSRVIDYNDREGLVQAFAGIETLFLLYPMDERMISWNQNALYAAKKAGVKHVVRSSGAGSNAQAPFLMPSVQGRIDEAIVESGLNYTITQPAAFMQNLVNFLANDIKNGTVYQPVNADAQLNWVDVRDIARVNVEIMLNPSKYLNKQLSISGSENLSYEEVLTVIGKEIGHPVRFVTVPESAAIEAMAGYGIPKFNIDMMMSLNTIINMGYAKMETVTVKEVTGKEPVSFSQFAKDHRSAWT